MASDQGFLQSIRETPDDDTPRLIYADWLEEKGDSSRAEFIRTQVALSRMGPLAAEYSRLAAREVYLLGLNDHAWLGELPRLTRGRPRFTRGFVESAYFDEDTFVRHWEHIFTLAPLLRHVHLNNVGRWRSLAACPGLALLDVLDLGVNVVGDEGLAALARSRHLGRLRTLVLSESGVGDAGLIALARTPLPCLVHLDIKNRSLPFVDIPEYRNTVGDAGLAALAQAPWPRLTRLELGGNPISAEGLRLLLRSRTGPAFTFLSLAGCTFQPGTLAGVLPAPRLAGIEELDLSRTFAGDTELAVLASLPEMTGLRRLALGDNVIGPEGVQILASTSCLRRLESLALDGNEIGNGAAALARSTRFPALRSLNLANNQVGNQAAAALIGSSSLTALTTLELAANDLTTLADLAGEPGKAHLQSLSLGLNRINAEGIRRLSEAGCLSALTDLFLPRNSLNNAGAQALASSTHLRRLAALDVSWTGMGPRGVRALADSPALPSLACLHLEGIRLGPTAVRALLRPGLCDRLRQLTVTGDMIDEPDREELQAAYGSRIRFRGFF